MQLAIYRERLYPSVSFSIALALSGPMVLLASLPFGTGLAIALGLLVPLGLNLIVQLLAPKITVANGRLVADRISVPAHLHGVDDAHPFRLAPLPVRHHDRLQPYAV